jgi:flagellar motor switch protein FliN/FliY
MAETEQAVEEKQDQQNGAEQEDSKKQAQAVDFPEAAGTTSEGPCGSIDILLDIDIPVMVAIGRTEIPVRRLLQLGPGSVLKLDKPIDEPVDLYIRDTRFATGNVVVVDDRFAVRINQILGLGESPAKPPEV